MIHQINTNPIILIIIVIVIRAVIAVGKMVIMLGIVRKIRIRTIAIILLVVIIAVNRDIFGEIVQKQTHRIHQCPVQDTNRIHIQHHHVNHMIPIFYPLQPQHTSIHHDINNFHDPSSLLLLLLLLLLPLLLLLSK